MIEMKALTAMRYGTRRLHAGDYFQAKPKDLRILEAIKKAEPAREIGTLEPPPADLAAKVEPAREDETLAAARAEYQERLGKKPFYGWDVATLREKIAAHGAD